MLLAAEPAADPAAQQNWPQWRGPLGIGIAPGATPPLTWSDQSNIKWKVKLPGSGTATPIVWGDRIFVQTAIPTGKKSEESAQPKPAADPAGKGPSKTGRGGFGGARPDGEIYQFALLCLDRPTGKTLWQKVLRRRRP